MMDTASDANDYLAQAGHSKLGSRDLKESLLYLKTSEHRHSEETCAPNSREIWHERMHGWMEAWMDRKIIDRTTDRYSLRKKKGWKGKQRPSWPQATYQLLVLGLHNTQLCLLVLNSSCIFIQTETLFFQTRESLSLTMENCSFWANPCCHLITLSFMSYWISPTNVTLSSSSASESLHQWSKLTYLVSTYDLAWSITIKSYKWLRYPYDCYSLQNNHPGKL